MINFKDFLQLTLVHAAHSQRPHHETGVVVIDVRQGHHDLGRGCLAASVRDDDLYGNGRGRGPLSVEREEVGQGGHVGVWEIEVAAESAAGQQRESVSGRTRTVFVRHRDGQVGSQ